MGNSIGTIIIVNRLVNDRVNSDNSERRTLLKHKSARDKSERIKRLRHKLIMDGLLSTNRSCYRIINQDKKIV